MKIVRRTLRHNLVGLSEKIKHWIEIKENLEIDRQKAEKNMCANFPPNDKASLEKKKGSKAKKTRDKVADILGTIARTLAKAIRVSGRLLR